MVGKDKILKQPAKVKLVKLARLKLNQKRIDLAMRYIAARNTQTPTQSSSMEQASHDHDHDDPDLEVPVLTEGIEWIDMEDGDSNVTRAKPSTNPSTSATPAVSYAQIALPNHVKPVNLPRSDSATRTSAPSAPSLFGSHALEHKVEVQPIFLAYSKVLSEGD